jgi:hypothetical protein
MFVICAYWQRVLPSYHKLRTIHYKLSTNYPLITNHYPLLFLIFFTFFSCRSISPIDGGAETLVRAESPEQVQTHWQTVAIPEAEDSAALSYYAGKLTRPRMEFYALRIDLSCPDLRIVTAGGAIMQADGLANGKFLSTTVSSFVRDNGLWAGINALPFDVVSEREGEPRVNIGIVISGGVMVSPPHSRFDALVFYADGGAAIVSQSAIDSSQNIVNAVGGFYRILEGGELVPRTLELKARHPRSAAGISPDGRYLFLLAIDGRRPGSAGGTEAETALLLRALGATEGINFDGGGSTALVLCHPDGTVRPLNTPIHGQIPGRERAVAGCLGVKLVVSD